MTRIDVKYGWLALGVSIGSIATVALIVLTVALLATECGHEIARCM